MKRALLVIFTLVTSSTVAYTLYSSNKDSLRESIIFFPLDPEVTFTEANTQLTLVNEKDNDEYVIEWDVNSILDREVYLRQDVSFLFADGRLKATLSEWEENSQKLSQHSKMTGEDSSHFISITYHHGEIHDDKGMIKSTQRMSGDQLYVIDSSFSPLHSFREPVTSIEKEWKKVLDHATEQQLQYSWNKLLKTFQIPENNYHILPLTDLIQYNDKPLYEMSMEQSQKTIGNLWEGLYKQYFLGIKKSNGSIVDPIGSTIPLILISKDLTHILILIETSEGEAIQLIQYLKEVG